MEAKTPEGIPLGIPSELESNEKAPHETASKLETGAEGSNVKGPEAHEGIEEAPAQPDEGGPDKVTYDAAADEAKEGGMPIDVPQRGGQTETAAQPPSVWVGAQLVRIGEERGDDVAIWTGKGSGSSWCCRKSEGPFG